MSNYLRFREIHSLYSRGMLEEAHCLLAQLQTSQLDLCEENALLRLQIQSYEDIFQLSRNLVFDGLFFWLLTGSIKQGPFCPDCYNRDGMLLRLTDDGKARHCQICGSHFKRTTPLPECLNDRKATESFSSAESAQPLEKAACNAEPARRKARIIPFVK